MAGRRETEAADLLELIKSYDAYISLIEKLMHLKFNMYIGFSASKEIKKEIKLASSVLRSSAFQPANQRK